MRWQNTETPTFAGAARTAAQGPAVAESLDIVDRDGNVVGGFVKAVDGSFSFNFNGDISPSGSFRGLIEGPTVPYSGEDSYQPVAVDLEIAATAGSDVGTDPKQIGPIMGNLTGETPTNDSNYLFGVHGAISVDASASDYPTAPVLGTLFDGAQAEAIVMANLDGDDGGAPTNAESYFGVAVNNNNASSGVNHGLNLFRAPNANYTGGGNPTAPLKSEIKFSNGLWLVALDTAITVNVTTTDAPAGSLGITSHATGAGKLFMSDGSKWQYAVVA